MRPFVVNLKGLREKCGRNSEGNGFLSGDGDPIKRWTKGLTVIKSRRDSRVVLHSESRFSMFPMAFGQTHKRSKAGATHKKGGAFGRRGRI